ncbi:FAD-binding and (Fe-S)-binding domain-containing protein [Streptomyces sp. TRM68416]|uniref:FAD-binding and (Fe-S)-binding domain-containing protein n=1 Tax=Streptomyces sp. TRM68416 TaxID=2758412 RepID=UPI001661A0EA|nr:FAD-binding and (Fe-S)-binding domain-containing protein [Streptomyces sp. TRM68416]MBD0842147.1 FAD-binding oxidoreductase [Streptomyces sp. TRM68416]
MKKLARLRAALPARREAGEADGGGPVGTPQWLRDGLAALVGAEQVLSRPTDLARYASDASPYRYVPRVVVTARHATDVAAVLGFASRHGLPVTFRAAGTSLNGQSQGAGILVDVRRHFAGAVVEEDGRVLRSRPGTVIARANAQLARHGRMLGPDPASSAAATVGGVVANNASGMSCGVVHNAYHTVRSLRVVLASGTVVDTAAPDADERLASAEPALVRELMAIKKELEADPELCDRIRSKFSIKNTNGYRLDAFLNADTPAAILRGLMVGSQGTLGFLDEIVFDTVPFGRHHATALLRLPGLNEAAALVPALVEAGAHAVELLDAPSLRSTSTVSGAPGWLAELAEDAEDAALLVEFRAADLDDLQARQERAEAVLAASPVPVVGEFTRDAATAGAYWRVRKGLLTAVGSTRPPGTVLLVEDVCVPPHRVADAARDLFQLLQSHGFASPIAGHASAGNLHFPLMLDPSSPEAVSRYRTCMQDLADLVLNTYGGALKGEHGTGRNMTPFVVQEWGGVAVGLMWRLKIALDPHGILNPGVILDDDPDANVRNLKTLPAVDAALDPCIECGFCEPACPSRDLTTTPRQRIVLQREMARHRADSPLVLSLTQDYAYDAVDTCAGDASCAVSCPVDIDTGAAMKKLRHAQHGPFAERAATWAARHFAALEGGARLAVGVARRTADVVGDAPLRAVTSAARAVLGTEQFPAWLPEVPEAAPKGLPATRRAGAHAVYVPACVNRIFGVPAGQSGPTVVQALVTLAERAGKPMWIPADVAGTCCGTIWHSKGYEGGHDAMAAVLVERLWRWSDEGRLPIVMDASSCSLGALRDVVPRLSPADRHRHSGLTIHDAVDWAQRELLPHLTVTARVPTAVVHTTCSMHQTDHGSALKTVAQAVADTVGQPIDESCCGFAGDRGFLHRELTESAGAPEAHEVRQLDAQAHLSANRTCEIGLHHASGEAYTSVIQQLERATRPPVTR